MAKGVTALALVKNNPGFHWDFECGKYFSFSGNLDIASLIGAWVFGFLELSPFAVSSDECRLQRNRTPTPTPIHLGSGKW